jgi:hypothetical protein
MRGFAAVAVMAAVLSWVWPYQRNEGRLAIAIGDHRVRFLAYAEQFRAMALHS